MNCKNCENILALESTHCNLCGQKMIHARFQTKQIVHEVFESLTNVERGFWYTLKMLIIAPHRMMREYLNGQTKPYTNIFRLIFLVSAVSFFINTSLGLMEAQLSMMDNKEDQGRTDEIMGYVQSYMMYIFFLMIPFFALASKLIFRRHKLYFAEHLILNSAWLTGTTILGFIQYIYVIVTGDINMSFMAVTSGVIFILYFTYANARFFGLYWLRALFASILHIIIGYIGFSLFCGVVGIIVGITFKLLSG